MEPQFIEADEAIKHLTKKTIHCFARMVGADWDKKDVIIELKRAKRIAWINDTFNHCLAIEPAEESGWTSVLRFDIPRPNKK